MEYFKAQPIEVFAVDRDFVRLTGSLPYTSLIWHRRYYSPGEYQMQLPADIYSPDWAYIICWDRPETGFVNKVQYDDTAHTPDGRDMVTVSGFFLEHMLYDVQFLVEETGTKEIEIKMPTNPNRGIGSTGYKPKLYYSTVLGEYVHEDIETGKIVDQEGNQVSFGGLQEVDYEYNGKVTPGAITRPDGTKVDGVWNDQYMSYWTDDGKTMHREGWATAGTGDHGKTYEIVQSFNGRYFFKYNDDTIVMATGVAKNDDNLYGARFRRWLHGPKTMTVEVKGPWQRTGIGEPEKVGDSVQLVAEWVSRFYGGNMMVIEPDIEGERMALDLSLKELGEVVYSTLQRYEAAPRIQYDFINNTTAFSVWRGDDLTQSANTGEVALLPDGYTALEYIESTGTQWINTGFTPDSNTRFTGELLVTEGTQIEYLFGCRGDSSSGWSGCVGILVKSGDSFRSDYGGIDGVTIDGAKRGERYILDKDRETCNLGPYSVTNGAMSFSSGLNMYLFGCNEAGQALYLASMRLWSFSIYDNGSKVRDFIPARRESDGAIGMFDVLNGKFHGNSGTGSFIAGPDIPVEEKGGRWSVFSSTWGNMYGYSASTDDSNLKNTCYVLYDYEEPDSFDENGYPTVTEVWGFNEDQQWSVQGYEIPHHTNQGYITVTTGDDTDTRKETALDKRSEKPECDSEWSREQYDEKPTFTTDMKSTYEDFQKSLEDAGKTYLATEYCVVNNLDTGTLDTSRYITDYDLGDVVDWAVEPLGISKEARITEVEEVYESSRCEVRLTIGDALLTFSKKIRRG